MVNEEQQEYRATGTEFKHEDTTQVMRIRFIAGNRFPIYPTEGHKFVAKIGDADGNYIGDYPVSVSGSSFEVKSSDLKGLDSGNYRLEVWESYVDSEGNTQVGIFPSPQAFVSFTINKNIEDTAWDLVKDISFQDLVNTAVTAAGQNIVVIATNTLPAGSQASVTQKYEDGKNKFTFNIPQGPVGPAPTLHVTKVTTVPNGGQPSFTATPVGNGNYNIEIGLPKGDKGDTPKRGTDYWTDADKQAIHAEGQKYIENTLSKMDLQPESFADLNAVKAKYPNGATQLIITDDGHRAVYRNGQWIDGGIYQAAGIGDNSVGSKQVSTISASKIIDNQLSPSDAEGEGNISVVGNNEYVMIASMEVQTAANLVGTFIPLIITSKAPLILTANVSSNLDTGYSQPLYITDKNKNVLRQLSNVNVPDKSTPVNVKVPLNITEDPGEYYLLIPSKATGVVTYRNLTVNASGIPSTNVVKEINDLATKIESSPMVTTRAFDTIINNDVQLDKVSATDGIELTRDGNTVTAKVNKANAAGDLQAIFFPVHVQNRNAEFTGTVKVAPINFPETYTQQIYLADAERNLGEQLGTFPVNSQTSADFKVSSPASQDFCIALIASVTGTFEFELTVNNSTGRNINLEEYTTWLDSGTYDHAHMDISRINYPSLTAKTIDGVEYVSPYHTFGVDNGRLNAIYVWTEKAGTYSFCVGKLDQNNLIVDGKYFDLELAKGFNSIGVNIRTDAASNLFMKITDGVSLYEGNQAIKVQTVGQHIDLGMYSGDYFQDNHGFLPFGYDVTSLSPADRIKDVEDQQRENTASITQLKGSTILTANNGIKYKLVVANDGTLSTKNMTPNKVRVFGNSLTATPEGFGLAASDPQHDYYYLMSQYILGKNSKADIQRHATGAWEWSTNSSDRQKAFDDSFKPYLDADTDLVIIQCMENVNSVAAKQTLAQDSLTLLQNIKNVSPNAQIIWMYGWWGDRTVFDPAQNACDKVGAKGINLNDIGTQKSMQSYAGQKRTLKDGTVREIKDIEASHPGDAGMKAIADRLIANFDF